MLSAAENTRACNTRRVSFAAMLPSLSHSRDTPVSAPAFKPAPEPTSASSSRRTPPRGILKPLKLPMAAASPGDSSDDSPCLSSPYLLYFTAFQQTPAGGVRLSPTLLGLAAEKPLLGQPLPQDSRTGGSNETPAAAAAAPRPSTSPPPPPPPPTPITGPAADTSSFAAPPSTPDGRPSAPTPGADGTAAKSADQREEASAAQPATSAPANHDIGDGDGAPGSPWPKPEDGSAFFASGTDSSNHSADAGASSQAATTQPALSPTISVSEAARLSAAGGLSPKSASAKESTAENACPKLSPWEALTGDGHPHLVDPHRIIHSLDREVAPDASRISGPGVTEAVTISTTTTTTTTAVQYTSPSGVKTTFPGADDADDSQCSDWFAEQLRRLQPSRGRNPIPASQRNSVLAVLNGVLPEPNMKLPSVTLYPMAYGPGLLSTRLQLKRDHMVETASRQQQRTQARAAREVNQLQTQLVAQLRLSKCEDDGRLAQIWAGEREAGLMCGLSLEDARQRAEAEIAKRRATLEIQHLRRNDEALLRCLALLESKINDLKDMQLKHLDELHLWDLEHAVHDSKSETAGTDSPRDENDTSTESAHSYHQALDLVAPPASTRPRLRWLAKLPRRSRITGRVRSHSDQDMLSEKERLRLAEESARLFRSASDTEAMAATRSPGAHPQQQNDGAEQGQDSVVGEKKDVPVDDDAARARCQQLKQDAEAERNNIHQFYGDQLNRIKAIVVLEQAHLDQLPKEQTTLV